MIHSKFSPHLKVLKSKDVQDADSGKLLSSSDTSVNPLQDPLEQARIQCHGKGVTGVVGLLDGERRGDLLPSQDHHPLGQAVCQLVGLQPKELSTQLHRYSREGRGGEGRGGTGRDRGGTGRDREGREGQGKERGGAEEGREGEGQGRRGKGRGGEGGEGRGGEGEGGEGRGREGECNEHAPPGCLCTPPTSEVSYPCPSSVDKT